MEAGNYAVSVLTSSQQPYSIRFATPGQHAFHDGEYETYQTGSPLLKGRLAGFDCKVVEKHPAGDHVILLGEVLHFDSRVDEPLIYAGRQYLKGLKIGE